MTPFIRAATHQLQVAIADRLMPLNMPMPPSAEHTATYLVQDVVGGGPITAKEAAERIVRIIATSPVDPDGHPPPRWWRTPLGQLVALSGLNLGGPIHVTAAAEILDVTRTSVYRYISSGDLVAADTPGTVTLDSVLSFMRKGHPEGAHR